MGYHWGLGLTESNAEFHNNVKYRLVPKLEMAVFGDIVLSQDDIDPYASFIPASASSIQATTINKQSMETRFRLQNNFVSAGFFLSFSGSTYKKHVKS